MSLPALGMPEPKGEYDLGATYPEGGLMSERYPIDMASREEKAAVALTRVAAIKSFMFCLLVSLYEMGIYLQVVAFVEPDGGTNCEKIQIMMDRVASLHSLHDGRRKEDRGEKFLANNAAVHHVLVKDLLD